MPRLPAMDSWPSCRTWATGTRRGLDRRHRVPFTTVAERLRPESLFDRFVAYRESLGMEVLPLTGATHLFLTAPAAGTGRMICLLGDRDLTANGAEVSFFGLPARMPAGPAALALTAGSPLMPVSLWYEGPVMHIRMHPYVQPPARARATRRLRR